MENNEYMTRLQAAIKQGNVKEIEAIKEQNANRLRKEYLNRTPRRDYVNICRATPNWNGCDYCDKFSGSGLECWKQDGKHNCRYCEQVKKEV